MSWLLLANNLTSFAVIVSCWWLAHQYSQVKPPGKAIAVALALLGFSTLGILIGRNVGVSVAWPAVFSKAVLSVALVLIIIRRISKGQK